MGRMIGIDLGTTNSLAAVWEDGESRLIPNAFGEFLTPSVVSVDENGIVYVGKTARERLIAFPEQTVQLFKRFMGMKKKYSLGNRSYLPEELSALVLRRLKEDAERYLGEPVDEAVISVPAYFGDKARTATKRAGQLAGFRVDRIINEPSAAALSCYHQQGEEEVFLVFDFGGGTLDVSLVECFENIVEILAVSGDNRLGGQDFDDAIATHFVRTLGMQPEQLGAAALGVLRRSAESVKRELTEQKEAKMVVHAGEIQGELVLERKDLVKICAHLFERMRKPIRKVLMDAGKNTSEISEVILVGGSCKMPVIQQFLRHLLKREELHVMDPDHMIAYGCGICAGIKSRKEEIRDTILTDICPFSLGVNIINREKPEDDLMSFLISRNSPLPVSKEGVYYNAYDKQKQVEFGIYQGESMYVKDNVCLGKLELDIPPRKAGEVRIHLRYTYDINGILEVSAYIPMTGMKKHMVVINEELGMSQAEIEEKLKAFEKLKINPEHEEENQYILSWGERLYTQCSGELREEVLKRMQYFRHTMKQDPYQLARVRKYLMVYLAWLEKLLEHSIGWEEFSTEEDWYEEEEEKEIFHLFREWDEEDDRAE